MKRIPPKRLKFISEYLKDFNGAQAAIRAGYPKNSARQEATRLLANDYVQAEIEKKTSKVLEACDVTIEKIVKEAALIAFSDLSQFLTGTGEINDPKDWPDEIRRGIQSFKVIETSTGKGDCARKEVRREIKTWDKPGMIEFLGKYLGMLKGKGDAPEVHFTLSERLTRALERAGHQTKS
jgi:phage terminase small subunit